MPEFSTRWIESGPITCDDSSSASRLVTTCFVNWSPASAAPTTAPRPDPLPGAGGERALRDRDRREGVRRRPDPDVGLLGLCCAVRHGPQASDHRPRERSCRSRCRGEAPFQLRFRDPLEGDDLVAARMAGDDCNIPAAQIERVCEQADDGVIRPPAFRRGGDPDLPRGAVPSHYAGPGRAGHDAELEPGRGVHASSLRALFAPVEVAGLAAGNALEDRLTLALAVHLLVLVLVPCSCSCSCSSIGSSIGTCICVGLGLDQRDRCLLDRSDRDRLELAGVLAGPADLLVHRLGLALEHRRKRNRNRLRLGLRRGRGRFRGGSGAGT